MQNDFRRTWLPHNAWYRFDRQVKRWSDKSHQYRSKLIKKHGFRETLSIGFSETYNNWINFGSVTLHPWKKMIRIDMPESTSTYSTHWAQLPISWTKEATVKNTNGVSVYDRSSIDKSVSGHLIRWGERVDYESSIKVLDGAEFRTSYQMLSISESPDFQVLWHTLQDMKPVFRDVQGKGYIYCIDSDTVDLFMKAWEGAHIDPVGDIKPMDSHKRANSPKMRTFEAYSESLKLAQNDLWGLEREFAEWREENNLDRLGRDMAADEGGCHNVDSPQSDHDGDWDTQPNPNVRQLYLMKCQRSGDYKIGIGKNPTQRESTLQNEKPDLVMVGNWAGMSKYEREWHKHFAEQRKRGEWFSLTPAQVRFFCLRSKDGKGPKNNSI